MEELSNVNQDDINKSVLNTEKKNLSYTSQNGIGLFLWVLLGSFTLSFFLSFIYLYISGVMELKIDEFFKLKPVVYINAFIMQIFFILIYFIFIAKKKISFIQANKLNIHLSWQQIATILVLVLCLNFFVTPFCSTFEEFLKMCGYELNVLNITLDNPVSIILCIIFLGIVPAFIEEFIFRGAILQGFKKYGKWVAIIVSALLFTFIHGNPQQTVYQFGCGLLFGLLVWETGSIWSSILLHAGNNILVLILQSLVDCGVIKMQAPVVDLAYVAYAFVLLFIMICISIFVLKILNKFKLKKDNSILKDCQELSLDKVCQENIDSGVTPTNQSIKFKEGFTMLYMDKPVFSNLLWGISLALIIILINLA